MVHMAGRLWWWGGWGEGGQGQEGVFSMIGSRFRLRNKVHVT